MTSWSAGGGGPRTPSHAHIERRQHQHDEMWLQVDGGDDAGASYVTPQRRHGNVVARRQI